MTEINSPSFHLSLPRVDLELKYEYSHESTRLIEQKLNQQETWHKYKVHRGRNKWINNITVLISASHYRSPCYTCFWKKIKLLTCKFSVNTAANDCSSFLNLHHQNNMNWLVKIIHACGHSQKYIFRLNNQSHDTLLFQTQQHFSGNLLSDVCETCQAATPVFVH